MKYYIYYLIIMSVITFFMYGIDKFKAIKKKSRISEMTLLNFSLFGGASGGLLGMYLFHHKTRKKIFVIGNIISLLIQLYIYYYFK